MNDTPLFVLDNSVAMSWFFEDESSTYSEAVLDILDRDYAAVPAIWVYESVNALITAVRRKRFQPDRLHAAIRALQQLHDLIDESWRTRTFSDAAEIAFRHDLSVYDAAYIDLAILFQRPLATLDRRMKDVAGVLGVGLFDPAMTPTAR